MRKKLLFAVIFLSVISSILSDDANECGQQKIKSSVALINNGTLAYHSQFPWLAPLFHVDQGYLCGSSVISQWHLLTAAHCITNSNEVRTKYIAILGRFDLSNSVSEVHWKRRDMSGVYVHEDFNATAKRLRSYGDIAILRMSEKIHYSNYIQPVCLPQPSDDVINVNGIVAGYGKTETYGKYQNKPSHVTLKSIDQWDCIAEGDRYTNIISKNSFCAGSDTSVPCQGDSGGGFLSYNKLTDQHTIYGIVSFAVGLCSPKDYVAFTDVTKYVPWIHEKIDNEIFHDLCDEVNCGDFAGCDIVDKKPVCSCLPQHHGTYPNCNKRCKSDSECPDNRACLNDICTDLCFRSTVCAAHAKCEMKNHRTKCECIEGFQGNGYSSCVEVDIPKEKSNLQLLQNHSNFNLINERSCATPSVSRITGGIEANPFDFPWVSLLGYKSLYTDKISFSCGGTLITSKFVITAAHCVNNYLTLVRLGEHKLSTEQDCDEFDNCMDPVQDIMIVEKIIHPKYDNQQKINDIALLKLATPADTTKNNVRTICLPFHGTYDISKTIYNVYGWGKNSHNFLETDVLTRSFVPYVERDDCVNRFKIFPTVKIQPTYFCVGGNNRSNTCNGDSGGGITKYAMINRRPKVVLYGVFSDLSTCDDPNTIVPDVYTDITYYLDWILDNLS